MLVKLSVIDFNEEKKKKIERNVAKLIKDLKENKYAISLEQFIKIHKYWMCLSNSMDQFFYSGKEKDLRNILICLKKFIESGIETPFPKKNKQYEETVVDTLNRTINRINRLYSDRTDIGGNDTLSLLNTVDAIRWDFHSYLVKNTTKEKDPWYDLMEYYLYKKSKPGSFETLPTETKPDVQTQKTTEEVTSPEEKEPAPVVRRRDPFLEELWRRTMRHYRKKESNSIRVQAGEVIPFRKKEKPTKPSPSRPSPASEVGETQPPPREEGDTALDVYEALLYQYDTLAIDLTKMGEMFVQIMPFLPRKEQIAVGKLIAKIRSILRIIKQKDN